MLFLELPVSVSHQNGLATGNCSHMTTSCCKLYLSTRLRSCSWLQSTRPGLRTSSVYWIGDESFWVYFVVGLVPWPSWTKTLVEPIDTNPPFHTNQQQRFQTVSADEKRRVGTCPSSNTILFAKFFSLWTILNGTHFSARWMGKKQHWEKMKRRERHCPLSDSFCSFQPLS